MTKLVKVADPLAREEMDFAEYRYGDGKTLSFEGPLLAVDPTPEKIATLDPMFKEICETGRFDHLDFLFGVVYFDTGAERAFIVDEEDVSIEEVE